MGFDSYLWVTTKKPTAILKRDNILKKNMISKSELKKLSKEEMFAKLNASAQRTLDALMAAYEAGMKEGISEEEQDQVIELMRRAKDLREKIHTMTSEKNPA